MELYGCTFVQSYSSAVAQLYCLTAAQSYSCTVTCAVVWGVRYRRLSGGDAVWMVQNVQSNRAPIVLFGVMDSMMGLKGLSLPDRGVNRRLMRPFERE